MCILSLDWYNFCGGGVTYKLLKFLRHKNAEINELKYNFLKLSIAFEELDTRLKSKVHHFDKDNYNYLAVGNSITVHEKCSYWWNEIGMAASKAENDYFHLVKAWLSENQENKVDAVAFNYYSFETLAHDRQETYSTLDRYLDPSLDLITIQLSENVDMGDLANFKEDFKGLLNYVKEKASKAHVIIIDDVWNEDKSKIKAKVAFDLDLSFVSLKELRGNSEYKCGIGSVVYGSDGQSHKVEHDGVAIHPGDKGMKYIADGVIEKLKDVI